MMESVKDESSRIESSYSLLTVGEAAVLDSIENLSPVVESSPASCPTLFSIETCTQIVRRSKRDPNMSLLGRRDVKQLLRKIRRNHLDTVVLKLKDHVTIDLTPAVMDKIITALKSNRVCQALYIQNLNRAIGDDQLVALVELLKSKLIWCLNIGESYNLKPSSWEYFCNTLPQTNLTHLYVSEHIIKLKLKNTMRAHIRANRKKHDKHCSLKNIRVIQRCTNMWWNPINSIRHELESTNCKKGQDRSNEADRKKQGMTGSNDVEIPSASDDGDVASGSEDQSDATQALNQFDSKWKFACVCKEICSYYENKRFHPVGSMFECTQCSVWAHTECNFGKGYEETLKELAEVLCHKCRCRVRRQRLRELKEMDMVWEDGQVRMEDGRATAGDGALGNGAGDSNKQAADQPDESDDDSDDVDSLDGDDCGNCYTDSEGDSNSNRSVNPVGEETVQEVEMSALSVATETPQQSSNHWGVTDMHSSLSASDDTDSSFITLPPLALLAQVAFCLEPLTDNKCELSCEETECTSPHRETRSNPSPYECPTQTELDEKCTLIPLPAADNCNVYDGCTSSGEEVVVEATDQVDLTDQTIEVHPCSADGELSEETATSPDELSDASNEVNERETVMHGDETYGSKPTAIFASPTVFSVNLEAFVFQEVITSPMDESESVTETVSMFESASTYAEVVIEAQGDSGSSESSDDTSVEEPARQAIAACGISFLENEQSDSSHVETMSDVSPERVVPTLPDHGEVDCRINVDDMSLQNIIGTTSNLKNGLLPSSTMSTRNPDILMGPPLFVQEQPKAAPSFATSLPSSLMLPHLSEDSPRLYLQAPHTLSLSPLISACLGDHNAHLAGLMYPIENTNFMCTNRLKSLPVLAEPKPPVIEQVAKKKVSKKASVVASAPLVSQPPVVPTACMRPLVYPSSFDEVGHMRNSALNSGLMMSNMHMNANKDLGTTEAGVDEAMLDPSQPSSSASTVTCDSVSSSATDFKTQSSVTIAKPQTSKVKRKKSDSPCNATPDSLLNEATGSQLLKNDDISPFEDGTSSVLEDPSSMSALPQPVCNDPPKKKTKCNPVSKKKSGPKKSVGHIITESVSSQSTAPEDLPESIDCTNASSVEVFSTDSWTVAEPSVLVAFDDGGGGMSLVTTMGTDSNCITTDDVESVSLDDDVSLPENSVASSNTVSLKLISEPQSRRSRKRKRMAIDSVVVVVATNQRGVVTSERPGGWKYVTFDYPVYTVTTSDKKARRKLLTGKHFRPSELCELSPSELGVNMNIQQQSPLDSCNRDQPGQFPAALVHFDFPTHPLDMPNEYMVTDAQSVPSYDLYGISSLSRQAVLNSDYAMGLAGEMEDFRHTGLNETEDTWPLDSLDIFDEIENVTQ